MNTRFNKNFPPYNAHLHHKNDNDENSEKELSFSEISSEILNKNELLQKEQEEGHEMSPELISLIHSWVSPPHPIDWARGKKAYENN